MKRSRTGPSDEQSGDALIAASPNNLELKIMKKKIKRQPLTMRQIADELTGLCTFWDGLGRDAKAGGYFIDPDAPAVALVHGEVKMRVFSIGGSEFHSGLEIEAGIEK